MTINVPAVDQGDPPATQWVLWSDDTQDPPPADVTSLLRCEASLTAALREHSNDRLTLQVMREEAADLGSLQKGVLTSNRGMVREVVLSGNATPWVFAQTLIPVATISAHPWLGSMGGRPLGDALFHRAGVTRTPLSFAALGPGMALYDRVADLGLLAGAQSLWARRSYFVLGAERLLITEVFLPTLDSHV